ncbi:uncharacterized protein PHA67_006545 [Liasis olivaceus]
MAAGVSVLVLHEEATCPICLDYFQDPVLIPECGHNFCRSCLTRSWGQLDSGASCPQCRQSFWPRNILANRQLSRVLEVTKQCGPWGEEGGSFCRMHWEPLKLFCKNHETLICWICDRSQEHRDHWVIPLEEAFQEYQIKVGDCLKAQKEEKIKIVTYGRNTEEKMREMLDLIQRERENTVAKFRELRCWLEEQEKLLLARMEETEKEIVARRDKCLTKHIEELSSLEDLIQEMEKKQQQPANKLLQDIGSVLEKYQAKKPFKNLVAFPLELKWTIWDYRDISVFLKNIMKQFRDTLEVGVQLQKANVILDPDTAHPGLVLSEDRKSIRAVEDQCLPKNPERFENWLYVLGCQEFSTGRHFWEVTVGKKEECVLEASCRDMLLSGLQLQRENVTLDPDTVNPWLVLSEDCQSVKVGEEAQCLPRTPERFDPCFYVLGREGFATGRHGWDVSVGREEAWCLGVSKRSVRRKEEVECGPEAGIWCIGNWGGGYCASDPPAYPPLVLKEEPKSIRVSLNCEGRRVAFCDANTSALLHVYSGASFSGEVLLPSFYMDDKAHLIISPKDNLSLSLCLSLSAEEGAMAAGAPVLELLEEAICPICLEYFRDPVLIPECGHNFCRSCLDCSWGESPSEASCPQCRQTFVPGNILANRQLARVLEVAKRCDLQGEEGGSFCGTHREPLKLFCQDHETLICVVCDRSQEHRDHWVIPLEEVALQEYQIQVGDCLKAQKEEKEKILTYRTETERKMEQMLDLIKKERENTVAEFRELRRCLEEQEKLLLARMEETEKEIVAIRDKWLAKHMEELSSLEDLIQEMEEKQQQPASKLLQDIGSVLEKYQAKKPLENPVDVPLELKWTIWDYRDISVFLKGVTKQFRDTLEVGVELQKANVILDPDTAHPGLILSKDRKSIRAVQDQCLPKNPERFENWLYVLGCQGFSTGRHFWEVTVGDKEVWAVGVARKSMNRKDYIILCPEEGIWEVGKWAGKYRANFPPKYPTLPVTKNLKRIRVSLNCEGGQVTFFDAKTAALLYKFSEAPLAGETLLPSFSLNNNDWLTLSP